MWLGRPRFIDKKEANEPDNLDDARKQGVVGEEARNGRGDVVGSG
jgi:hypothetical protein